MLKKLKFFIKTRMEFYVLASILLLRLLFSFPLNNEYILASDFFSHFFKVWYVSRYGITDWNYFWYGGYPFLYYYSPLSYIITGYLAKITNPIIAYKLISDIIFIFTPFIFYLLTIELGIYKKQALFSTFIFSIFPIYSYYMYKGAFPTHFSLPFLLLGWLFFMKYLKTCKKRKFILSLFFFTIALLTHHFSFFIFTLMIFSYLIFKDKKIHFSFVFIIFLTFLMCSWFILPVFLNCKHASSFISLVAPTIPRLENLTIPQELFYALTFFVIAFGLVILKDIYKIRNCRPFLNTFILFSIITLFFSYKRPIYFLPIYASIVLGYMAFSKIKIIKIFTIFSIAVLIFSFIVIKPKYVEIKNIKLPQNIYEEGRVICLPVGSCLGKKAFHMEGVLFPMNGKEVITGLFPQSQSPKKILYEKLISNPLNLSQHFYYTLLREGFVNTIIVNKDSKAFLEYFNNSGLFEKIYEDKKFLVFSPREKFSYIELNKKPLKCKVKKLKNKILIETFCEDNGILLIKESYHPAWKAWINGQKVKIKESKYGFMEIPVEKGECKIILKFSRFNI